MKRRVKARLVIYYLEKRGRELLEKYWRDIDETIGRTKIGVYALYAKSGNIYYLGVARKNIVKKLLHHLNDRHKNKWYSFSLYVCKSLKQISALETLFLRLSRPKGNKIAGRFKGSIDLANELRRSLNEKRALLAR
ncbi:hypothetical protein HRbin01_00027 [archaeon HR01]|nr:hypothetical protein HRbin01_00027 [archaeon HR01]